MGRLQHSLNNTRNNPDDDFHLAIELDQIFSKLEQSGEIDEFVEEELDKIDDTIHIPEIYDYIKQWHMEGEFQAVQDVLPLLQDGINRTVDNEWYNVAAEYHYQTISLKSGLSGHDADTEIEDALSYLLDNHQKISSNRAIRIVDLIQDNLADVGEVRKGEWIDFVEEAVEKARSSNDFDTERSYLRKLHSLKSSDDEDTSSLESDLIETYRKEADSQGKRSFLIKADVLRSGINEFGQYMSDDLEEDWKMEALEARKQGTEEEMIEMNLEDLPNAEFDGNIQEAIYKEMEQNRDFISNSFKNLNDKYNSTIALYNIIASEALIPDVTRMRLEGEQFVLQNMVSRKIISPEYNTLSKNPMDDEDNIPTSYGRTALSVASTVISLVLVKRNGIELA